MNEKEYNGIYLSKKEIESLYQFLQKQIKTTADKGDSTYFVREASGGGIGTRILVSYHGMAYRDITDYDRW